jgi:hypothetical protein
MRFQELVNKMLVLEQKVEELEYMLKQKNRRNY